MVSRRKCQFITSSASWATGLMTLLFFGAAWAQGNLSVEFRPAANQVLGNPGSAGLNHGGGFEAVAAYRFAPPIAVYAGWGANTFATEASLAGANTNFVETGYTFGIGLMQGIRNSPLSIIMRGGGVYNHLEVKSTGGDLIADSGFGLGWQIETGLAIAVGRRWKLIPGIRYHQLSRNIVIGATDTKIDLSYLSLGLGVNWQF
ncbi:MAG TPA: outer membrane beta-barrel protein [Cyclobacteriaceae bacterium]|nr:outer membrane beta-barrel protein [Cyclobacteriaceae bacterium]